MQTTPILVVDDDDEDLYLLQTALLQTGSAYSLVICKTAQEALDYLRATPQPPFLVLTEIHLKGTNGIELRQQLEADPQLRKKAIPFVFWTSPVEEAEVDQAYELTIQGYFEKKVGLDELRDELQAIINYWEHCLHPNRFKQNEV